MWAGTILSGFTGAPGTRSQQFYIVTDALSTDAHRERMTYL